MEKHLEVLPTKREFSFHMKKSIKDNVKKTAISFLCLFSHQSLWVCPTHHFLFFILIVVACVFARPLYCCSLILLFNEFLFDFIFFLLLLAPPDWVHLSVKLKARLSTGTEVWPILTIAQLFVKFYQRNKTVTVILENKAAPVLSMV